MCPVLEYQSSWRGWHWALEPCDALRPWLCQLQRPTLSGMYCAEAVSFGGTLLSVSSVGQGLSTSGSVVSLATQCAQRCLADTSCHTFTLQQGSACVLQSR